MSEQQISGLSLTTVLLAFGLILTACSGSGPPDVPEAADGTQNPVLVLGRDVYAGDCSSCHGASGGGKRGPRLAGGSVVERFPDPADQASVVADGRGGMPAFGGSLSPAEIEAVVAYTREVL